MRPSDSGVGVEPRSSSHSHLQAPLDCSRTFEEQYLVETLTVRQLTKNITTYFNLLTSNYFLFIFLEMSALEQLKGFTKVVADTGDFEAMAKFQPEVCITVS